MLTTHNDLHGGNLMAADDGVFDFLYFLFGANLMADDGTYCTDIYTDVYTDIYRYIYRYISVSDIRQSHG
jgi:hypothetical protein